MRKALDKEFDEQNFFNTLEQSFAAGYQRVKLYFMIGLPQEEEEDLEDIVKLSVKEKNKESSGLG